MKNDAGPETSQLSFVAFWGVPPSSLQLQALSFGSCMAERRDQLEDPSPSFVISQEGEGQWVLVGSAAH